MMFRRFLLLALLACPLLAQPDEAALIRGHVTDDLGGPVEGASIDFLGDTYNIVRTGPDGSYELMLEPGGYFAYVEPPPDSGLFGALFGGFFCTGSPSSYACETGPGAGDYTAVAGEQIVDWVLPRPGLLRGRATRASDGAPLADVEVRAEAFETDAASFAVTDADGVYEMSLIPWRSYGVLAKLDDFSEMLWENMPCQGSCEPSDGTPVDVLPGETSAGIDFPFNIGEAEIRGRITADDGVFRWRSVQVLLYDENGRILRSVLTDDAGEYVFRGLGPGRYFVVSGAGAIALREVYDDILCPPVPTEPCDPTTGTPIEIVDGDEIVTGIDIDTARGMSLDVEVFEEETGEQISTPGGGSFVSLWAENGRLVDFTDFERFNGLLPGTYFVATTLDDAFGGQSPWIDELWEDIPCPGGPLQGGCDPTLGTPIEVGDYDPTMVTEIDMFLRRKPIGSLAGRVRGILDGGQLFPLAGISVRIWRRLDDGSAAFATFARTDAEGFWRVDDLPSGTYFAHTDSVGVFIDELWEGQVCLARASCDPATGTPIVVSAGEETRIDFQLTIGGQIRGNLSRAAAGTPFDGEVALELYDADGRLLLSRRPTQQVWGIQGLPDGDYFLRTRNSAGYLDQLWRAVPCLDGCPPPTTGTPLEIRDAARLSRTDFALSERVVDAPDLGLVGDRFEVQVRWETRDGQTGDAKAVRLTDSSGYFWFFGPRNVEMVVKVLDACRQPSHAFWVFAAGLTNVGVEIEIHDRLADVTQRYENRLGEPFRPIQDTRAFDTCDAGGVIPVPSTMSSPPIATPAVAELGEKMSSGCVAGPDTLCLGDRFRVRALWETAGGGGDAQAVPLTRDTGFFWFFGPDNIEVVVKVLDACALPSHAFWVFAGGLTNVGVKLEVKDLVGGETRIWENRLGKPFQPIQETQAFLSCP